MHLTAIAALLLVALALTACSDKPLLKVTYAGGFVPADRSQMVFTVTRDGNATLQSLGPGGNVTTSVSRQLSADELAQLQEIVGNISGLNKTYGEEWRSRVADAGYADIEANGERTRVDPNIDEAYPPELKPLREWIGQTLGSFSEAQSAQSAPAPQANTSARPAPAPRPAGNASKTPQAGAQLKYMICSRNADDKPADYTQVAQQTGYTCVDDCPAGYDSYGTQIGALVCIRHIGQAQAQQLPACKTAKDCAAGNVCLYAMTATDQTPISWTGAKDRNGKPTAALRCAPSEYANFLLHTGGVTSVDESGTASTSIA